MNADIVEALVILAVLVCMALGTVDTYRSLHTVANLPEPEPEPMQAFDLTLADGRTLHVSDYSYTPASGGDRVGPPAPPELIVFAARWIDGAELNDEAIDALFADDEDVHSRAVDVVDELIRAAFDDTATGEIVASTPAVAHRPSPRELWTWAWCYVHDGPVHESECSVNAAARVVARFDLPSVSYVMWNLDGWHGFRPRSLAYELHFALLGDEQAAAGWEAQRLAAEGRHTP